jgi:hypothetical protein
MKDGTGRRNGCYFCDALVDLKVPISTNGIPATIPSCRPCADRAVRHREHLEIRACQDRRIVLKVSR